ncbi:hypothetical protein HDV00_012513 [Rhizophlyctis rosea]|nr:hypothetical protein HDV00_012513 [Rhizophlyctis rosea]
MDGLPATREWRVTSAPVPTEATAPSTPLQPFPTTSTVTVTVTPPTLPIYTNPVAPQPPYYDPSNPPPLPTPPAQEDNSGTTSVVGTHLIAFSVFLILALVFVAWRLLVRFTSNSTEAEMDAADFGRIVSDAAGRDGDAPERAAVWADREEGDGRVESWSGFVGKEALPVYRKECGEDEVIVLGTLQEIVGEEDERGEREVREDGERQGEAEGLDPGRESLDVTEAHVSSSEVLERRVQERGTREVNGGQESIPETSTLGKSMS